MKEIGLRIGFAIGVLIIGFFVILGVIWQVGYIAITGKKP